MKSACLNAPIIALDGNGSVVWGFTAVVVVGTSTAVVFVVVTYLGAFGATPGCALLGSGLNGVGAGIGIGIGAGFTTG